MTVTIWNSADETAPGEFTLSALNLKAAKSSGAGTSGLRTTNPKTLGLLYAEMTFNSIGFRAWGGMATAVAAETGFRGNTTGMFGVDNGASVTNSNSPFATLALGVAAARVLSIAVDFTHNRAWCRIAGGTWNGSGTADPATNVGGADISAWVAGMMLMFQCENTTDAATINVGGSAFAFTIPAGFSPWDSQVFPNTSFGSVIS